MRLPPPLTNCLTMKQYPKNKLFKTTSSHKASYKVVLGIIILFAVWELTTNLSLVPPYILPPFSKVIDTLLKELINGNLSVMTGRSLFILIKALLFNIVLSICIVFLCQCFATFRSLYDAIAAIMNSIPNMALLPLIIMWFGIGNPAILALVTHSVVWTFTIYLNDGINAIPKIYKDIANNLELSTLSKLKDIYLPAILPNIISGLKISWGRAWRSLIGAEIVFGAIGSDGGLGYYININRLNGNMSKVLAGVMIIAIVGVIVDYGLFNRLYSIIKKWGVNSE